MTAHFSMIHEGLKWSLMKSPKTYWKAHSRIPVVWVISLLSTRQFLGRKKRVYNQFYLTVSDLNVAGSCSFAAMKRDGELLDEFAVRKDMYFFRPSNFESPTVKGNFFPGRWYKKSAVTIFKHDFCWWALYLYPQRLPTKALVKDYSFWRYFVFVDQPRPKANGSFVFKVGVLKTIQGLGSTMNTFNIKYPGKPQLKKIKSIVPTK